MLKILIIAGELSGDALGANLIKEIALQHAFQNNSSMKKRMLDKVRRKNTSRFNIDTFIDELQNAKQDFYAQSKRLQEWANIKLDGVNVADILKSIVKSDRKAEKMNTLYEHEIGNRGANVFALYSAFTNYSSYADEQNGFKLKEMGNDTESLSMWAREQEVSKWISSNEFKKLELVA